MTIELGKTSEGKPVRLDIDRLISTRMLLQANSGGGKSWAIRRLLEQTHGQVQQLVIDPEGEFYTLREKFDFVLCGKGGDCPAEPRSAALLARRLLELGCSAVIDIHELKKHERIRFVRLFLESLVDAPRKLWHPAIVVIDEADVFAPQAGQSESLSSVVDLMARGRKRGFCGVLATQRISKLHKDAAAETNNVFIGRARQDIDRKRAAEELGLTSKAAALELRSLKPGEFFSFGPALDPGDVTRFRFGAVKTSHPKEGAGAPSVSKPRAKVRAILGELADLPAEAEEEARSLEELRAKVRELQAEARKAAKAAPRVSDAEIESIREEAKRLAQASADESIGEIQAEARALAKAVRESLDSLTLIADQADRLIEAEPVIREPAIVHSFAQIPIPKLAISNSSPRESAARNSEAAAFGGGCLRMLVALASRSPAGFTAPQWATLSKLKHTGGTWSTYLSKLKVSEYIEKRGDLWHVTDAGIAAAGTLPPTAETPAELIEMWKGNLGRGPGRMLDAISRYEPTGLVPVELAEAVGITHTGGTFGTYLSKLNSNGLIDKSGGTIRLSEVLR